MTKTIFLLLRAVCFSCALLWIPAFAFADQVEDRELIRQVDEVFAEWDSTDSPGCALSVIRGGAVVYSRGYGMANLEHGLAITPRSIFRIGSTSKQFTAAAIALLAEQGKISLDDDIRKHVPELPEYQSPVTVQHLIHHTSGVRDYLGLMRFSGLREADYYTNEDVVAKLARQKNLNFPPGDEHLYSNSGYFLLSVIIERASGKTLREFAEEYMFRPLGMRHTHFHDDHRMIVPHRADGYGRTDDGFEISKTTLEMVGDGGVFTSVEDLFLWDQNFYHNQLGRGGPALLEQLQTPGVLNSGEALTYAFGLSVEDYQGLRKVSHGGAFVGYRAEMIRFPDEELSVICLCNLAQTNPSRLAQQVADLYLADKLPAKTVSSRARTEGSADESEDSAETETVIPAKTLARVTGSYFNRAEGRLRKIEARDGKLFYVRGPSSATGLRLLGEDRFRMIGVGVKVDVWFEVPKGKSEPNMVVAVEDGSPSVYERVEVVNLTKKTLAEYTGQFYSEELDVVYELSASDVGLVVKIGTAELELMPAARDIFTGPITVEFSRDATGRAGEFFLAAGRIRGIGFRRQ